MNDPNVMTEDVLVVEVESVDVKDTQDTYKVIGLTKKRWRR